MNNHVIEQGVNKLGDMEIKYEYKLFVKKIRAIWCKNLCIETVEDDDNYFVLGGNSLRGIKLLADINLNFDTEVDYNDIFEYQEFMPLTERIYELVTSK